jgi:hypothetical protein
MNARSALLLVTLGSVLAIAAGCGGGDGGGGGGGGAATLTGQAVDDGSQQPLRNAVAQVGARTSDPTTANGVFMIAGVPTGAQTLTVTAAGHQAAQRSVALVKGANDVGIWYLPPQMDAGKGAITGRVVLASGNTPVGGAVIQSGQAMAVSRSDGTGRFTLYNIPAGMAQITFSDAASGAGTWRYLNVSAGSTPADIGTVTLSFGPPPPPIP